MRRPAAEVGLWLAVTFLTCGYYGLFALVGILPLALLLVRRNWFRRSRLVEVALALLCFAPAVPILLAQERLTADYERSEETTRALSARVGDFSELTGDALGAGLLPWVRDGGDDIALYSGTALDEVPDDVIAFLPFPIDGKATSYAPTVDHMLDVLDAGDGVTTANGYSGLWPDAYEDLQNAAVDYPTAQADFLFHEGGVTLLVVDAGWLTERPDVVDWLGDRYVESYEGPDSVVYTMPVTGGTVVSTG